LHEKALNCLLFPNLFSASKTEIIFKPKREVKLRAAGFFYWNENNTFYYRAQYSI
jgi:hypothetical protein